MRATDTARPPIMWCVRVAAAAFGLIAVWLCSWWSLELCEIWYSLFRCLSVRYGHIVPILGARKMCAVINCLSGNELFAQESRAVARKPRDAAAIFFGLKFADSIHYKFKSSQASKATLKSSKHTGAKQNLTQNGHSGSRFGVRKGNKGLSNIVNTNVGLVGYVSYVKQWARYWQLMYWIFFSRPRPRHRAKTVLVLVLNPDVLVRH